MKTRLIVLGLLHREDMHPYEMKRRVEAAMLGCYLDMDVGTLYYAVRQLAKDGAIAEVKREVVVHGGSRTIYRITDAGRAEFEDGFFRQFEDDLPVSQTLYGAMLFVQWVDRDRLVAAIRARVTRLDELISKLGPMQQQLVGKLATGSDYLLRHIDAQRRLDRDWLAALLSDIETNGVRDAPPLSDNMNQ